MILDENALAHYGILRRSGRYPWGSGGTQNTRNKSFLDYIQEMRSKGLTDTQIAQGVGISTTRLRAARSIAKNQQKQVMISQAQRLKDKGMSGTAAAAKMGIPEPTYRTLLAPGAKDKADILISTSAMLKRRVDADKFIDIGSGSETHVKINGTNGISKEKLHTAVTILEEQGYTTHVVNVRQLGTGKDTKTKVLCPPGTTWGEAQRNSGNIRLIREFTDDGGRTFGKVHDPLAIHPNRVSVRYKDEGGAEADGIIYVRPGVHDVSIGKNMYAQVRVQVGEGHFIKGMAMYKEDLPEGTDLVFNTNKKSTGNKLDAMKPLTNDPDLPFGSIVRQVIADKGTPNERVTSVMNIVNEEGDWSHWSKNISAQALSKQKPALAKEQLDVTYEVRQRDLNEIRSLNNPTVKRKLLETFADSADSAAVHLKAAALPKSRWHVILPLNTIHESEIYATGYQNGDRVALIRYPHGGTFEIPDLVVNNKNREARRVLGEAPDAVGIHPKVAHRLSGADFDGDTVLVIPNNHGKIKSSPALEGLKNFDPIAEYPAYEGMPKLSADRKQQLMGDISNLITDMTIKGASHEKLARAVRHSMVIIDAEKHNLNYKESAIQNGIKQLKIEYQGGANRGAATLISRAKSPIEVPSRRPRYASEGGPIDEQGRRVFVPTGQTRLNKEGQVVLRKEKSTKMAEAEDAHLLSSGTPVEKIYADHANRLKALANQARLEAFKTPPLQYSRSAKEKYASEVASLESKLALVKLNRPLERQAQIIAANVVRAKREANPELDKATLKKLEFQQLTAARNRLGIKTSKIVFTPKEWDAIQAGAISENKLRQMLDKADIDVVREKATPRTKILMTPAKTRRAHSMLALGYTRAEVAQQLGVSLTTLDRTLSGDDDEG